MAVVGTIHKAAVARLIIEGTSRMLLAGKPPFFGMLPDKFFIFRFVNTIDLVTGNITAHPLNSGSHFVQYRTGFLRDGL